MHSSSNGPGRARLLLKTFACYVNFRARGPQNRAHRPKQLHSNSNRARLGRARHYVPFRYVEQPAQGSDVGSPGPGISCFKAFCFTGRSASGGGRITRVLLKSSQRDPN